jgi:hypothetical protein
VSKYNTDISPAITELKRLHEMLLNHIEASVPETQLHSRGLTQAHETVISILPGERRREDGWYKWRMWEKKSDSILHELDPQHKMVKYHEIFIAGEALSRTPEQIVLLMMHQVAHQAAAIQSTQSYHSEWIKIWLERLFKIPQEAIERDEVMGWYLINQSKLGDASELVSKLAKKIAPEKFDLFRLALSKPESTGKMYRWTCACRRPVIRTGGVPVLLCEKCGELLKLHRKGVPEKFWAAVKPELRWNEEV